MSGRGGRRTGSGRPLKIEIMARLWIGARCENLFRAEWDARIENSQDNLKSATDIEMLWAQARSIPLAHRECWHVSDDAKLYRADVEIERADLKNLYGRAKPVKRPYGVHEKIIAQVIDESEERYGQAFKASFIRDCWDEFRSFEKSIRPESDPSAD